MIKKILFICLLIISTNIQLEKAASKDNNNDVSDNLKIISYLNDFFNEMNSQGKFNNESHFCRTTLIYEPTSSNYYTKAKLIVECDGGVSLSYSPTTTNPQRIFVYLNGLLLKKTSFKLANCIPIITSNEYYGKTGFTKSETCYFSRNNDK